MTFHHSTQFSSKFNLKERSHLKNRAFLFALTKTVPENSYHGYNTIHHGRALTVSIEGNIGSGKSTFLEFCRHRSQVAVYPDPVESWRSVGGVNLLDNFYREPTRWALAFQMAVGESLLDIYTRNTWKSIRIVKRSLLSSRHCFVPLMRRMGTLDPASASVFIKFTITPYDEICK